MNKFKLFFIVVLIFILSNLIIAFLWSIKTTIKFSNYAPYSVEFTNSLNLTKNEALDLYLETWQRERLFEYDEFTGLRESESLNGNYVNIDQDNGRLIKNNPNYCLGNIFFYGGEKVFGYDVTDNQTIPFFFREMLIKDKKNYCVFNFGRRSYNSTQENILLQKHLLNKKIIQKDIIIFLDGSNENGNSKILNTDFINKNYNELHQKYWKLGNTGVKYFFNLLPIKQLFEVVISKFINSYKTKKISTEIPKSQLHEIKYVFEKNLDIRKGICHTSDLRCFNFLIFVKNDELNKKKYELLKTQNNVSDLTNFNNQEYLINKYDSLSPNSNRLIAEKIFKKVFN